MFLNHVIIALHWLRETALQKTFHPFLPLLYFVAKQRPDYELPHDVFYLIVETEKAASKQKPHGAANISNKTGVVVNYILGDRTACRDYEAFQEVIFI